jgi:hypothetical protein
MVTASALVMVIATPSQNVQQRYHLTRGSLLSPVSSRNLKPSLFTLTMCSYLRLAFVPCVTTVTGSHGPAAPPAEPQHRAYLVADQDRAFTIAAASRDQAVEARCHPRHQGRTLN